MRCLCVYESSTGDDECTFYSLLSRVRCVCFCWVAKCGSEWEWAMWKNSNFWRCVIDCKISFFPFPYFTCAVYWDSYCAFSHPLSPSRFIVLPKLLLLLFELFFLRQRHVLPSNRGTWNWICWFKCVMSKYSQWHSVRCVCIGFSDGKIYDWKIMVMVLESTHISIVVLFGLQFGKISNSVNIIMRMKICTFVPEMGLLKNMVMFNAMTWKSLHTYSVEYYIWLLCQTYVCSTLINRSSPIHFKRHKNTNNGLSQAHPFRPSLFWHCFTKT